MTIFEKTLYMQRLLFHVGNLDKLRFIDKQEAETTAALMKSCEHNLDAVINDLEYALELRGILPRIRS